MCVQRSPSALKAMHTCRKLRGLLFLPWLVLATSVHAETASFADKTIKIMVGMPPGGGVDSYARLVQRHVARFLAGAPTVMVQNMPGAGSLRSVMALANSSEDAIGTFSSSLITEAISVPDRVKLDFRNFAAIGNVSEDIRVCYTRSAIGVRRWSELVAREQVIFGATAPGTSGNIDTAMLRNLFGVRLKQVQGYAGSADKRLALEKGEIDGDCGGFTSLPEDWLRGRKIDVLVRLSPTLVAGLDRDVPFGGDLVASERDRKVYDFLTAPERLGRLFMVPAKVSAERVAALRTAFDAMVVDPGFLAEAQRSGLTVTPMSGGEVDRAIATLYATPPDILARARTIAGD
jgi:tripartite-type tricarboxylate transporter receptor subunit TctC